MKYFNSIRDMLLDLLYPPKCPLCGTLIDPALPVCEACRGSLPHIRGGRCRICGRPVSDGEEICADCGEKEHSFDRGAGAFLYEGAFRESLGALKYRGEAEFGKRLGYLAAEELSEMIREWRPDRIVPIPLHKKRFRRRGYNQAERIADEVMFMDGGKILEHGSARAFFRSPGTDAGKRFLEFYGGKS